MDEGRYGFDEIDDRIRHLVYRYMERRKIKGVESLAWVNMMLWKRDWDHVEELTRVRR